MKKINVLIMLLALMLGQACRGPEGLPGPIGPAGPQGPAGPAGPAGEGELSTVFDITGSFTAANDYSILFEFNPEKVQVFDSDVVLVYLEWDVAGTAPNTTSIWRQLPQVVFLNQGILQYNFDFTLDDVSIFLDGTANLGSLPAQYTTDQVFRIVVVPAAFAGGKTRDGRTIDFANYDEVIRLLGLSDKKVPRYQAK